MSLLQVFALSVIGFPFLFFFFVAWLVRRDRKVLLEVARRFACMQCGTLIGEAGVDRADALWGQHMQTLMAGNPHLRFRVVRTLHGVCLSCGARYRFIDKTRSFTPVQVVLAFEDT